MAAIRKPFQGVINIVRFNWQLYTLSGIFILLILLANYYTDQQFRLSTIILCSLISATAFISLIVSFYIYDLSGLYSLKWIDSSTINPYGNIINIHAGFDETSTLIHTKYPNSKLQVFDFYDPRKHTEASIKIARKAYPPYSGTVGIDTNAIPLPDNSADTIFSIFSAHEIRDKVERITFFKELNRVIKFSGEVIITEHLRDVPNFLAYNIGFFHFFSKPTWLKAFSHSNLTVSKQIKITPFITTFILQKNGVPS